MVTRILTIIAVLAAIAAIVLGNTKLKEHITKIRDDRNEEKSLKERAEKELKSTKITLKTTEEKLSTETTKRNAAETSLKAEREKTTTLGKEITEVTIRLNKTTADLTEARQHLARWDALNIKTEDVRAMIDDRKRLQLTVEALTAEKLVLSRSNKRLQYELEKIIGTNEVIVQLPVGVKGKITVVDPKWDFVMLNIGEQQGLLPDGIMMVHRKGRLVGKVKISSVQPARSTAKMMPGWKLEDLMEGDEVLF